MTMLYEIVNMDTYEILATTESYYEAKQVTESLGYVRDDYLLPAKAAVKIQRGGVPYGFYK